MARNYELKAVYNYGIGGSRLAHQNVPSDSPRMDLCFCGRAHFISRDADVIVVYGGVNDYLHGDAPIGNENDMTPASFHGAVNYLMNFLKTSFIGRTIVFMTPAHCLFWGTSDSERSKEPCKKSDAMPLQFYVEIIENAGKKYGIPVLNLFDNLGLDPNDEKIRAEYAPDGLHFNDKGHYFLAKVLGDFLESL